MHVCATALYLFVCCQACAQHRIILLQICICMLCRSAAHKLYDVRSTCRPKFDGAPASVLYMHSTRQNVHLFVDTVEKAKGLVVAHSRAPKALLHVVLHQ